MKPIINPEYEKIVPPHNKDDLERLDSDIKENGVRLPLELNIKGVMLDGHTRWKLVQKYPEHLKKVKFNKRSFPNPLLEKKFVIESNLNRRHLNTFQKAELIKPLMEIEAELANQRKLANLRMGKKTPIPKAPKDANGEKGKTVQILAKRHGLSATTLERAKAIIEKADPELISNVRTGKTSIAHAYKLINRQNKKEPVALPEGVYDLILADTPKDYTNNFRGSPDDHYDVMSTEKLIEFNKELEPHLANNAILFYWSTAPHIENDLTIIKAWGFNYVTHMIWVKIAGINDDLVLLTVDPKDLQIGTGYRVRGAHELLFICTRGKFELPQEHKRPVSVIFAERTEHSKKPDVFYKIIEDSYPGHKMLELYARRNREGWISWGKETK